MYKKILVPMDGSEKANAAAEHAIELAAKIGAEVTLYHVIPALTPYVNRYSDNMGDAYQQIQNELQTTGEDTLQKAQDNYAKSGVKLDTKILWGNPAEEICREARERGFDLIVMGSRGLGEISGFIMGSVSRRVARHASTPVLIVR
jgi:nucleotide-binding universal stress UspA family protein